MTTTEVYVAPPRERPTTTAAAPDLVGNWRAAKETTRRMRLPYATTEPKTFEQSMRELAALSVDPNSLARDSEGNVWGFGADA
jgi:hypothetical protein